MQDPVGFEKNYANHDKVNVRVIHKLVQNMIWKLNEKILDFGCGTGVVTKNMLLPEIEAQMPNGGKLEILGVDISKSGVDYAVKTYPHAKINYTEMNILEKATEFEGYFDKIFACNVLHWIPDIKPALQSLHKMLKVGGEIAFYCPIMYPLLSEIEKAKDHPEFGDCFHMFSAVQDYAAEMKHVDFEIIDSTIITQPCFYETPGHLMDMLITLGLFRAPPGKEASFKKYILEVFRNWSTPAPTEESPNRVLQHVSLAVIHAKKI